MYWQGNLCIYFFAKSAIIGMNLFSIPMQTPHVAESISKARYAMTTGAQIEVIPYFMNASAETTAINIKQELRAKSKSIPPVSSSENPSVRDTWRANGLNKKKPIKIPPRDSNQEREQLNDLY
jgi:hypothetical protein